ncbi:hypothetical protein [Nonomuraea sediminis]|uniref:hypothetical protein n=1 Tax=Nonomuraea sediminis TaxID=2835864 RepID=UPI001BDD074E|nr:hypothetical protein [Nonomuraea sediminis]
MELVRAYQGLQFNVADGVVDAVGGEQHQSVGNLGFANRGDDSRGKRRADPCVVVLGDFGGDVSVALGLDTS